jgi:DNA-directed RNA polymerase subunit RPC12/RpoP
MEKRPSLFRAITRPLSILLFWQATGWIAFGFLEPSIASGAGMPENPGTIMIVSIAMTALTATLGAVALFLWKTTSQKDFQPKVNTHHKCPHCGYPIETGMSVCPHCGSKTLF